MNSLVLGSLVLENEVVIRLSIFLSAFMCIAVLERTLPRRLMRVNWRLRWFNNLGISVINTAFLRIIVPTSVVLFAMKASDNGWGLLNMVSLPEWLSILIFIAAFDLAIYFQHRWFHIFEPFWRLHRVHHTDLDYDITTGTRFHPFSILISLVIKFALVLLIGGQPMAVLISEVLLNLTSMFNHSNINIPARIDRVLRLIVVTPDMHRVHHSVDNIEHNSNFGFNFPWWDRIFGTYLAQPTADHGELRIGIEGFDENNSVGIRSMLVQPFKSVTT